MSSTFFLGLHVLLFVEIKSILHHSLKQLCIVENCSLNDDKVWVAYLHESMSQGIEQCVTRGSSHSHMSAVKCLYNRRPSKLFIQEIRDEIRKNYFRWQCPSFTSTNNFIGMLAMPCQHQRTVSFQTITDMFSRPVKVSSFHISFAQWLKANVTVFVLSVGNQRIDMFDFCSIPKNTYRLDLEPFLSGRMKGDFCQRIGLFGMRSLFTLISDKNYLKATLFNFPTSGPQPHYVHAMYQLASPFIDRFHLSYTSIRKLLIFQEQLFFHDFSCHFTDKRQLASFHIVVKKTERLFLKLTRAQWNRPHFVHDGPGSRSPFLSRASFYYASTFQLYFQDAGKKGWKRDKIGYRYVGIPFTESHLTLTEELLVTAELDSVSVHSKGGDVLQLPQKLVIANTRIFFCVIPLQVMSYYIKISIERLYFLGSNYNNCLFGGIAILQRYNVSKKLHEMRSRCEVFNDIFAVVDADFVSEEQQVYIVIYSFLPYSSISADVRISKFVCKGLTPCFLGNVFGFNQCLDLEVLGSGVSHSRQCWVFQLSFIPLKVLVSF